MRGSRSAGDALRHLLEAFGDDIRHDFVLVGGDVISNMKLKGALEAHRRRKAEPRYVMTSIF
ncbi:MAG: hypothetical protein Q8P67_06590, partial [archaeon]|nr:hypothetical protein [archaeon]